MKGLPGGRLFFYGTSGRQEDFFLCTYGADDVK